MDDMPSELDQAHQELVLELLRAADAQVMITAIDASFASMISGDYVHYIAKSGAFLKTNP